jgi:hypothetical protein
MTTTCGTIRAENIVKSGELITPTPRAVAAKIDLHTLDDVRREMGKLYREARAGRIDTRDATRLAYILGEMVKLFAVREIEARVKALEGQK